MFQKLIPVSGFVIGSDLCRRGSWLIVEDSSSRWIMQQVLNLFFVLFGFRDFDRYRLYYFFFHLKLNIDIQRFLLWDLWDRFWIFFIFLWFNNNRLFSFDHLRDYFLILILVFLIMLVLLFLIATALVSWQRGALNSLVGLTTDFVGRFVIVLVRDCLSRREKELIHLWHLIVKDFACHKW